MIRLVEQKDAKEIAAIYAPYVDGSHVSFEFVAPGVEEIHARIRDISERYPWYVWESEGRVVGYAYGAPYRSREAYQWNAEVSVYVQEGFQGQGIARKLYERLIPELHRRGFINLYAIITQPNPVSVRFHEAQGFSPLCIYRNVGFKLGKWHDVGWWELRRTDLPVKPKPVSTGFDINKK